MTRNRRFKSLVRARAAKTGESYTSAFRHLRKTDPRLDGDDRGAAPSLRIAVAQSPLFNHLSDRAGLAEHGERLRSLMRAARNAEAKLIQFPETSLFQPEKRALSSCGPTEIGLSDWSRVEWFALRDEFAKLRSEAKGLGLWTVIGLPHRTEGSLRPFNSLFVVSDTGEDAGRYDERMLSQTKANFMYESGNEPLVFEIEGFRFGCALGMESHYPELAIDYEGRDVDCLLMSTTGGTGDGQRAFEAEIAGHAASLTFWTTLAVHACPGQTARSAIAGPHGVRAARAARGDQPNLIYADIITTANDPARLWRRQARDQLRRSAQPDGPDRHPSASSKA